MTTKDLQEGVRKRSIVLSFAVDGDFTFAPSTGFVLPDPVPVCLQALWHKKQPALCCRMSPLQQT